MASEFKGTKGPYRVAHDCMILGGDDAVVAECSAEEVGIRERECNLQFVAESCTVLHTTGKTTRELAGDVEALTEKLACDSALAISRHERLQVLTSERDELAGMLSEVRLMLTTELSGYRGEPWAQRILARVNQPAAVTDNENAGEPGEAQTYNAATKGTTE